MRNHCIKKRAATLLILCGFFLWIIPLGAFVEAHQEGLICNGRRMACMCTHRHHRNANKAAPLTFRRPGGRGEPGLQFPSFGGHMEAPQVVAEAMTIHFDRLATVPGPIYLNPSVSIPEPVPKSG